MIHLCQNKSQQAIKTTADFLNIISQENRLRIICFLIKNGQQCVCEIWKYLDLPQNLVSHHLKVLRDFELVKFNKIGQRVCYQINQEKLKKYQDIFNQILDK